MERAFIVTPGCEFHKAYEKYQSQHDEQMELVKTFMLDKGIESKNYQVTGQGSCGVPFTDRDKKNIRFGINPTPKDKEKFEGMLKTPSRIDICYFKANTQISKDFAQKCVDNQIVINLWRPQFRDYFKSLGLKGCSHRYFEHNGTYYASIDSDALNNQDTKEVPTGFTEIKLSELYRVIEEIEVEQHST